MQHIALALDMLHHDHTIGAAGDRRPSHNFHGVARGYLDRCRIARANGTNDLDSCVAFQVSRAAGKPVAGRARKRRLVTVGMNRLRQYHAEGGKQFYGLRRTRRRDATGMLTHDSAAFRIAHHLGWSLQISS